MSGNTGAGDAKAGSAGKDGNRKSFREQFVGLIPELPTLNVKDGDCNPIRVQKFMGEFKIYTMSNMVAGLDNIFMEVDPAYPEFVEPDAPDDARRAIDMEKWKLEWKLYSDKVERLKADKIKLTGAILGQLGPNSRDRVEKLPAGRAAIDEKNPLELVKAIIATHLVSSRLDNQDNFYQSQVNYNSMRMGDTETIENYYRRFRGMLASLTQAALAAGKVNLIPDDKMQAIHFIYTLSASYSEFKLAYDRNMLDEKPDTSADAYEAAIDFGLDERPSNRRDRSNRMNVFVVEKRGGGRGRGRGRGEGRGGRGFGRGRGNCAICKKPGHWKNECPERQEHEDIAKAVKEVGGAKSNK